MSEFDDARAAHNAARTTADALHTGAVRAAERVKLLRREIEVLSRGSNDATGQGTQAKLDALRAALGTAEADVARLRARHREAFGASVQAANVFGRLADPVAAVSNLGDDVPIALLPLRLETRFVTSVEGGVTRTSLRVRAYPDDVLVDTFQPEISENEYANTATYWSARWRAAGDATALRGAWAGLVKHHGAGRAHWLIERITPSNLADEPAGEPLLPARETLPISQSDWTRGARAWLLPERLVLLGFRGGAEVLRAVGNTIPSDLRVGPDPSADPAEQLRASGPDVTIPEPLRWMTDFDAAVGCGMGFAVDLTALGVAPRFDRLFVVGVRVGSDAARGAEELSELLHNHRASRKGLAILPQGRPTNNTDTTSAGYSWWEDPDESYAHFFETDASHELTDTEHRKDGAWLAGLLGIDTEVLRRCPGYHGTDQAEARAMNRALWPATLGYYMEQMLEPVFSEDAVIATRRFFNRFVIGRGTTPLVRIGRQPYGVLPVTAWSRSKWWQDQSYGGAAQQTDLPAPAFVAAVHDVVERAVVFWRSMSSRVASVGDPGPDPLKTLLDVLGLHPASVEHYQRYSQSFTQFYNLAGFATEPVSEPLTARGETYVRAGLVALGALGWRRDEGVEVPELLEKIFLSQQNLLTGHLVQATLSDASRLDVTHASGSSYVGWLRHAAQTSHDVLRKQEGFAASPPTALLYLFLHHALDLGFVDAEAALQRDAFDLGAAGYRARKRDPRFFQIVDKGGDRSTWEGLYSAEPAITGHTTMRLGDFIPTILAARRPYLQTQIEALEILDRASSGGLERAFVEHIDCLSYRLDAWRMGLVNVQLASMRHESPAGFGKRGLHVGAFGWLEDVSPRSGALTPADLSPELGAIFGDARPMRDASSEGHIHAPSIDQAVTAAVLRSGHRANATPAAPELLAVDLASERVRLAQRTIDGIRNGQTLGALLGYQLERALHDEPGIFLDRLLHGLRRAFPLAGNHNETTRVPLDEDVGAIEAQNVVDGAAFVEHVARVGVTSYPYGVDGLPPLASLVLPGSPPAAAIGAIIDGHVARVRGIGDAVADLAVAEGVYQMVRGNADRAAGNLEAFSKGAHPPVPEVSATPRGGRTITHRVALHLQPGLPPAGVPRSQGEPALAAWISEQMPDPATVFARIAWRNVAAGEGGDLTASMADLGLDRIDLFYMLDGGGERMAPGFDDLLIDHAERHGAPRPRHDATFDLSYHPAGVPGLTLFEVAPLARALRGMVLGARALRTTDLALQNEATAAADADMIVRTDKIAAVRSALSPNAGAVTAFADELALAVGAEVDPELAADAARDGIDAWMVRYGALVRAIVPFGLEAASLTTAVEGRRRPFTMLLTAIDEIAVRWRAKQVEYDEVMTEYAALPPGATDEARVALLLRAGRTVSSRVVAPIPPLADFLDGTRASRAVLDARLLALETMRRDATHVGALLTALGGALPLIREIDLTPFDVRAPRESVLALARELLRATRALGEDVAGRLARADDALGRLAAATSFDARQTAATEAIQALLGKVFVILPELRMGAAMRAEWENAWAHRGDLLRHLEAGAPPGTSFPVEDWLHGVARVRERARHLENATLLGEALGATGSLALEALQLPHRAGQGWVGAAFPATAPDGSPFVLEEDKLLYSAVFATDSALDPGQPDRPWCGLLIDEWIESIPTERETTGLAFHFDRPNAEAPQAILLVTPPERRGAWQLDDVVAALHETLDMARLRAVEPAQIDQTLFGPLVPAVLSAVTVRPITAMLDFALNNDLHLVLAEQPT